jgi:hypothetical protein
LSGISALMTVGILIANLWERLPEAFPPNAT